METAWDAGMNRNIILTDSPYITPSSDTTYVRRQNVVRKLPTNITRLQFKNNVFCNQLQFFKDSFYHNNSGVYVYTLRCDEIYEEKKEEIWLRLMTKAPTPYEKL